MLICIKAMVMSIFSMGRNFPGASAPALRSRSLQSSPTYHRFCEFVGIIPYIIAHFYVFLLFIYIDLPSLLVFIGIYIVRHINIMKSFFEYHRQITSNFLP